MIDILSITGAIFVVIAVGFFSVRWGLFSSSDMEILGKFVVNFALPALILRAVATRPIAEVAEVGYLAAVLVGSVAVFTFGYFWSRRFLGETASASTFGAMGMSCANSGFIGFPILLIALPEVASKALALNMIVENLVMIPLVLIMAEYSVGGGAKGPKLVAKIGLRLVRNPIVIALVLGLAVAASGYALPAVVARPIDMFATASAAVSLTVIGGTIASLPMRAIDWSVLWVVFGKLVLHPAAIALSLIGFAAVGLGVEDRNLFVAAIIMASTPVMAIYPILAQRYGEQKSASLAVLVMTVASFLTISLVMALTLADG